MELSLKTYGVNPIPRVVELIFENDSTTIITDIANSSGEIPIEIIENLDCISEQLKEQNSKVYGKENYISRQDLLDKMLELLQTLENDSNTIPESIWADIQETIKQATE